MAPQKQNGLRFLAAFIIPRCKLNSFLKPCNITMSIHTLQRVLWRLRNATKGNKHPYNRELQKAIMWECGTDDRTVSRNRLALKRLGWIKPYNRSRITLTDLDLVE